MLLFVDPKGSVCKLPVSCFSDISYSTLHAWCLVLLCCRTVVGFVWTSLLRLFYLLPKVYLLYFEDLKYWEGKYSSLFLFPGDNHSLQGFRAAVQKYVVWERPLAMTATESYLLSYQGHSRNILFTMQMRINSFWTSSKYSELWHYKNTQSSVPFCFFPSELHVTLFHEEL